LTPEKGADKHRAAMVVPGPVTSALSVGCHAELRDHPQTRLVCGTAGVIAELTVLPGGSRYLVGTRLRDARPAVFIAG
jgi:hypothetical protein